MGRRTAWFGIALAVFTAGCALEDIDTQFTSEDVIVSPFTGATVDRQEVERMAGKTNAEVAALLRADNQLVIFYSTSASQDERWADARNPALGAQQIAFLDKLFEAQTAQEKRGGGQIPGRHIGPYEKPQDVNGSPMDNPFLSASVIMLSETAPRVTVWHESLHPLWNKRYLRNPVNRNGKFYSPLDIWDEERNAWLEKQKAAEQSGNVLDMKTAWANWEFYSLKKHAATALEEFDVYYAQLETADAYNFTGEERLNRARGFLWQVDGLGAHSGGLVNRPELAALEAEIETFPEPARQRIRELRKLADDTLTSVIAANDYLRGNPNFSSLYAN